MAYSDKSKEKPSLYPQIAAGLSACLSSITTGISYGWSSPVGRKMTSIDLSETPLNKTFSAESDEIAWMSSIFIIGILATSLLAIFLADRIGRKRTLMTSAIFYIISFVVLIVSNNIWIMCTGRILQGFGAGIVIITLPIYNGEIASDNIRGTIGSFMGISLTVGVLYSYVVGSYSSYFTLQIACAAIPILFITTFSFMPESPYYLVAQGKKKQGLKSLKFLRRQSMDTLKIEINMIQSTIEESKRTRGSVTSIFKKRANLRAFLMGLGLNMLQQFCGFQSVLFNAELIFKKGKSTMDSGMASIIVAMCQVVSNIVLTPYLIERCGRKMLLLISYALMAISLLFLGLFFYLDKIGRDTSSISWLPLVSLTIYLAFSSIGVLRIPFTIYGEIFSPEIKFIASAILSIIGATLGFVITRFYSIMITIGIHFPFWFHSVACGAGFVFILLVVFETKGLSLKEIQAKFNK